MTLQQAHLDHARRVADAVLYEGYLLYPYRAAARKNQARFQFGVLMPPAYGTVDDTERACCQTECLVDCADDARVDILLRFLRFVRRTVLALPAAGGQPREVDTLRVAGTEYTSFDEAQERHERVSASVADLLRSDAELAFGHRPGETGEELTDPHGRPAGRLVRRWAGVDGVIRVHAERVAGPYRALKLRIQVENRTVLQHPPRSREDGLRHALIAAHTVIGVDDGAFVSMTEPPEWAAAEVAGCVNVGTWPVLAGPADCRNLMLSSPIILYDHPEIAPESAGDLFDATEIDEILTLRTLALTDEEKQQARATDPRAAELIDRLDHLPHEMIERLHGAVRYLSPASGGSAATRGATGTGDAEPAATATGSSGVGGEMAAGGNADPTAGGNVPGTDDSGAGPVGWRPSVPWWDPGSDASVSPETDSVVIAGVSIAKGSRVTMRPGARRADAQDLFLAGREAFVEAVLHDVDGQVYVAVTPVGDPAADLKRSHGRFLYFAPEELEPVRDGPAGGG